MIGKTTTTLETRLRATGAGQVRAQVSRVSQAIRQAGSETKRATAAMTRYAASASRALASGVGRVGAGLGRMGGRVMRGAGSMAGMFGIGLGVAGFASIAREVSEYDSALVSAKLAMRMTAKEAERMDRAIKEAAKSTGRNRTELLELTRTANDFGMSWQTVIDDLELDTIVALTDLLGLKGNEGVVAAGLGGMAKLAGDELSPEEQMALVYEMQGMAGTSEGAIMKALGQVGPMVAGLLGGGREETAFMLRNIAAVGGTYAGKERALGTEIKGFLEALKNPRYREALEDMGVNTDDANQAQQRLLEVLAEGGAEAARIPETMTKLLVAILNAEGGLDRWSDVYQLATGDLTESTRATSAALDEMKDRNASSWAAMLEQFKAPLQDIVRGVLGWFVENGPAIKDALLQFWDALKSVAEFMGWIAEGSESSEQQTVRGAVEEAGRVAVGKGEDEEKIWRLSQALQSKKSGDRLSILREWQRGGGEDWMFEAASERALADEVSRVGGFSGEMSPHEINQAIIAAARQGHSSEAISGAIQLHVTVNQDGVLTEATTAAGNRTERMVRTGAGSAVTP